jgi:hypothetical protein
MWPIFKSKKGDKARERESTTETGKTAKLGDTPLRKKRIATPFIADTEASAQASAE